jgi:hypothetical protein
MKALHFITAGFFGVVAITGPRAEATTVYALTENNAIFSFDSSNPEATFTAPQTITGLDPAHDLVGIDMRPADRQLYALGYASAGESAQLYMIDPLSAGATAIGAPTTLPGAGASNFFGFDFNPVVDRIRVVTSSNTNYRLNPDDGSLVAVDTMLSFAGGGGFPAIGGVAYSNNFDGATETTLFGYEMGPNQLVTIGGANGVPSPNGGQVFMVGGTGIFAETPRLGFDIGGASTAFVNATVSVGPAVSDRFYSVDLATGQLTLIGLMPVIGVEDIAVVPEPSSALLGTAALIACALRRRRQVSSAS